MTAVSQRCGEWTDEGGPCFEGWRHVAQSPPLTLDGLKADSAEDIGRGSFMGWPAQYACPNGYIWTPPANISLINSSLCSTRLTSQIACVSCLAGSYSFIDDDQKNITGGPYRCVQCETGFYSSKSGAGGCLPCPNNTYAATSGATACTACPAGKTTNRIGAWAAELCYVCPSGTGDCGSCRLGEYQLKMGQVYCLLTPPGTYSSTLNAIAPTPCSPGKFACAVACLGRNLADFEMSRNIPGQRGTQQLHCVRHGRVLGRLRHSVQAVLCFLGVPSRCQKHMRPGMRLQ